MSPELLDELLSKRVIGIDEALIRVSENRNARDEALTIRAHLIDLLALLDRNPGLDAAVDDLYKSVAAFVEAGAHDGRVEDRHVRLLTEAYARFRGRLEATGVEFFSEDDGERRVRLKKA